MKKLLGIVVLGLLLSGNASTAELSTKTYINCEPIYAIYSKDKWFKTIFTDVKYIGFNPSAIYYEWHSEKGKFLKKSKRFKVWDYQYIFQINYRLDDKIYKWDELQIDRYTGIMKVSKWHDNTLTKERHVSSDREFRCEKIEKKDLPKITKKQKF